VHPVGSYCTEKQSSMATTAWRKEKIHEWGEILQKRARSCKSEKDLLVKLHVKLTVVQGERVAILAADPTENILFW